MRETVLRPSKKLNVFPNGKRHFMTGTHLGSVINADSFEEGVLKIADTSKMLIERIAEEIEGFFKENSKFIKELNKAFCYNESNVLKGISFTHNGIDMYVTKESAEKEKICSLWEQKNAIKEKYPEVSKNSLKKVEELKTKKHKETLIEQVVYVDEFTTIEFKDEKAYEFWKKFVISNSKDSYSRGVITYARRWAKYMQYLMNKHNKDVSKIARNASHICDIEGISGAMHYYALDVLIQTWKYGEELNEWKTKNINIA